MYVNPWHFSFSCEIVTSSRLLIKIPLIVQSEEQSSDSSITDWFWSGPVPLVRVDWSVVTCSKIHGTFLLHIFSQFRVKCDLSVHLDVMSHFVKGPVTIEFQSALNTTYEISNFLHISDVVLLTRNLVSDLNSVLIYGQRSDFLKRNSARDKDHSSSSNLLAIGTFYTRTSNPRIESHMCVQRRRRSTNILEELQMIL